MSIRLLLLRVPLRSHTGARICPTSFLRLNSTQARPLLKSLHEVIRLSLRRASTAPSTPKPAAPGRKYAFPESITIYHAGTGRTTFIACLKLTTIFVFVFFAFVVTPAYLTSDRPIWQAGGIFLCGLIPLLTVALTTSPFVTSIHIRLPPFARQSRAALERWARAGISADTPLVVGTMSFIGKPRVAGMTVADLVPTRRRFGLVNYVRRDVEEENRKRKWYMFPAVGKFHVAPGGEGRVRDGFIWREVVRSVERGVEKGR